MRFRGKGFLSLRDEGQQKVIGFEIRRRGGKFYSAPAIRIQPPDDNFNSLDRAIKKIDSYEYIVFTSANGVRFFMDRLRSPRVLTKKKIIAIGPATRSSLLEKGLRKVWMPADYRAEGVIELFRKWKRTGGRVLIARAKKARAILPATLRKWGFRVTLAQAYHTAPPRSRDVHKIRNLFRQQKVQWVLFTSPSTAEHFFKIVSPAALRRSSLRVASIGPVTSQALDKRGGSG